MNVTPPELQNPATKETQLDIISQEMGVFDSQDSQVNNNEVASGQEKEAYQLVSQILDNSKIDKRVLFNALLSKIQVSGDLPHAMSKDLVQIQRHLKSESNLLPSGDYSSIYNNEKPIGPRQKNISYLPVPGVGVENSDSLYDKDEKSLSQGLHEYADLMNQMIDNKSPPAQESHSIIDIEQIDLQGGKEQQSGSSRSKKGAE